MVAKDRDASGRYSGSVDDADVVAAVRAHDPAATSEIATELGVSRQGADKRLRDLRDRGEVSSKKIGASLVWFMPRGRGRQTPRDSVDRTPEPEADQSPTDTPSTPTAAEDGSAFDSVDFPGERDREQCIEAINAAREFLQEDGPATMREIVAAVHPDYPLGYDAEAAVEKVETGERYRGAWWRRIVKPGLEAAADIQKPSTGQSNWRYTGGGADE